MKSLIFNFLERPNARLIMCAVAGILFFFATPFSLLAEEEIEASSAIEDIVEIDPEDAEYYGVESAGSDRFPIRARLTLRGEYNDNVFISQGNKRDDFIWNILPDVYYESSDPETGKTHYVKVGYNPEIIFFTNLSEEDSINQRGYLDYRFLKEKLEINFSHNSAQASGATRDIGNRSERTLHDTSIDATYDVTDKFFIELGASQELGYYDRQADLHEWIIESYFFYQVLPKLSLGIGPKIGFVDIGNGPNQTYQAGIIRAIYEPTEKLSLTAFGGADFRQFERSLGLNDEITPVFGLGLNYQPFDSTTISVNGYRRLRGSTSLRGQNFTSTGFNLTVRQRFFQKFYYTFFGNFENSDYNATRRGVLAVREDDYWLIKNSLEYEIKEWATLSLYHEISKNDSNVSDFVNNKTGFQATIKY